MKRKNLTRRRFIQTGSAGLIGFASLSKLTSFGFASDASASSRRVYSLSHDWLFIEKNLPNATQPRFNDLAFKRVTIPHTNKMLPWHGFDDKEYEFGSIYRRHFRLPPELRGRRVFIDFGGVMTR
jgi:beta-galactosidase